MRNQYYTTKSNECALTKIPNIQNYYMSRKSRAEHLNGPREVVIQIANAENNVTHLAELKELLRNYMIRHQRVRHSTSTLELYEKHIENYTKELEETWNEAGGVCPLCESPMSFEHSH